MRIYFPVSKAMLRQLSESACLELDSLDGQQIFGQTPYWLAGQTESDPEILDDLILQTAAQGPAEFVIVAEVPADPIPGVAGRVAPTGPIRSRDIAAFFAKDSAGDLSWYGPSELANLLELGQ
ncbi:MAG: hypothetical protein EBR84_00710 [Actinobacteria bacterium]|nr:hypothetical protein [Actinomycetota bacterium]